MRRKFHWNRFFTRIDSHGDAVPTTTSLISSSLRLTAILSIYFNKLCHLRLTLCYLCSNPFFSNPLLEWLLDIFIWWTLGKKTNKLYTDLVTKDTRIVDSSSGLSSRKTFSTKKITRNQYLIKQNNMRCSNWTSSPFSFAYEILIPDIFFWGFISFLLLFNG